MITSITWLVMLTVFSSLSMNLILQFGLGLKGMAFGAHIDKERLLAGSGILFVTVIFLWLVFSFTRSVLFLGLLEYVVLFPVSSLVFSVLEYLTNRFILDRYLMSLPDKGEAFFLSNTLAGGAFAAAALFLTLNVAGGFLEAVVLSLGFSCSVALVFAVVDEIRRRAQMEAVPHWLRGGPLALIAMGLLSLVFSSGALMLFGVLGAR